MRKSDEKGIQVLVGKHEAKRPRVSDLDADRKIIINLIF
jgi:hypothetical protein